MTRQLAELSAAQLEIMNVIWERREATITEVWQELRQRRKVARATVQTMILRLEQKGWLTHRDVGQTFMFSAAVNQADTQRSLVTKLCDRAFDGSAAGLVWALLDDRGISKKELERIRQMIANADKQKQRRTKS